jgi:hypothetical protein
MRKSAILLLPLALGACAVTPEQKVRAALVEAGVPDPIAECMAGRMTKKLSVPQLLKLRSLSHVEGEDGRFSASKFVRRLVELDDPQVVLVTSKAALRCAIYSRDERL